MLNLLISHLFQINNNLNILANFSNYIRFKDLFSHNFKISNQSKDHFIRKRLLKISSLQRSKLNSPKLIREFFTKSKLCSIGILYLTYWISKTLSIILSCMIIQNKFHYCMGSKTKITRPQYQKMIAIHLNLKFALRFHNLNSCRTFFKITFSSKELLTCPYSISLKYKNKKVQKVSFFNKRMSRMKRIQ